MKRRALLQAASAAAALGLTAYRLPVAQAKTPFKFNLGWKYEASAAGFLIAKQRGYYDEAGLDVTIDTGNGSTAAISLVASGAYDAASADLASMIDFMSKNDGVILKSVAMQYDLNPNAVIVRKNGPIQKPADFVGKRILGQPYNASRKLFPVFAKDQGFDDSTIVWENLDPGIGDTRFAQGDFDAAAYFYFTGLLNLKGRGVDLDTLTVYRYSDYGMKSYGNGIIANAKAMANADAMKAFVAASTRGWIDAIADPKAGGAAVKKQEPLANQNLETERLELITTGSMVTPATRRDGWGAATPERLQATIDETVDAFKLSKKLTVSDIWTDAFLPSADVRKIRA